MEQITLVGPQSEAIIKSNDIKKFNHFLNWLQEYNPIEGGLDFKTYNIKSENRLIASKIKTKKLGLIVK